MGRFSMIICAFFACAQTAFAACSGTDVRPGLTQAERAQIDARLAETPYARGNHWRAVRGGQTIHLIGTVHIDDPRLDAVTERLDSVIETSDMALFEMTPTEEAELEAAVRTRPDMLFLKDTTLPEVMGDEDWQVLMKAVSDRGLPPVIASRFQPWYLSVLLAMPPCLTASLADGANGLDHRLMEIAQADGVPMKALEPFDTLFTVFADFPLEEQIDQLMLSVESDDLTEDMLATLRAAYFEESHAEVWEMSRWQARQMEGKSPDEIDALLAQMESGLLVKRNRAWVPVILDALEGRQQITVAAGAAHLNGTQGVLALLEAEGFALERLPF